MRKLLFRAFLLSLVLFPTIRYGLLVMAGQGAQRVRLAEIKGFVYADNGFFQPLDTSSPDYSSNFDADGLGGFGWQFTNNTGAALTNLRFVVFVDADIDRDANTFFNEHGSLIGLALPPGAPAGAVAASSWEIDEPGFLFGDITQHLATGALDNSNGVPASARNDVSLALGFKGGTLPPGAAMSFAFSLSRTNIGGLLQTDPDSNFAFYFNGHAKLRSVPPAITPSPIARQQGSPGAVSIVATVSDDLTAAGDLAVTIFSAPAGIAVTGLTNNNGTVSANVAASCTAALGANTIVLQVADGEGQTKTGNLIVNVTPNTPPSLGAYASPVTVNLGGGLTVTPAAPPADNGTIVAITATAPSFTGSLSVNPSTGAVAIGNAAPVGTHPVTIRATDNCGAITVADFSLRVLKSADISVAMTDSPDPVKVGDQLTYTITVSNSGPSDATGVSLNDPLPDDTTFVSAASSIGGCAQSNRIVACNIGGLAAGAAAMVTLAVTTKAGTIINAASAAANEPDPQPANNLATQSTLATECGLSVTAPAVTRGFARSGNLPDGDWFLLPERFKQSVVSQANDAVMFAVDRTSFGDGVPGLPGLRLEGLSFPRQNITTRVLSCEDSFKALSLLLAANGNSVDDAVRLFLQTPNGAVIQELALFTTQNGGARLTQLNSNLTLYLDNRLATGPGQLLVGDFIPFNAMAGSSGARSGLLTVVFSGPADSPLNGCFQLGMDARRGAAAGAVAVVFAEVLANRTERPGDRLNAGAGLIGGLGGGFPTGLPCAGACPLCQPGKCFSTCFRSPQYYALNLERLVASTHLGGQAVFIGGVNYNQPVDVQSNIPLIRMVLRGGPLNLPPATPLQRLNQGFVAAQLSLALTGGNGSPYAFSVLMGQLGCYSRLANFGPVRLSNGVTLTPDSMLAELFEQALFAIQEKRTVDMDPLAGVFALLNGNDPQGRCY